MNSNQDPMGRAIAKYQATIDLTDQKVVDFITNGYA